MAKYFLRPKAVEDINLIWDYTVETWGFGQAERYVRMLDNAFSDLAKNPTLGRMCDIVRDGYRKHLAGRHVIFYRVSNGDIEIVRILHQRMDYEQHI